VGVTGSDSEPLRENSIAFVAKQELAGLRAEVERYREALECIAYGYQLGCDWSDAESIAREALNPSVNEAGGAANTPGPEHKEK